MAKLIQVVSIYSSAGSERREPQQMVDGILIELDTKGLDMAAQ